jgi:hypothetical protein
MKRKELPITGDVNINETEIRIRDGLLHDAK